MACDGISGQSLIGKLVGTFGENYSQVCQYSNMFTNKIVETNFTYLFITYIISVCVREFGMKGKAEAWKINGGCY